MLKRHSTGAEVAGSPQECCDNFDNASGFNSACVSIYGTLPGTKHCSLKRG